METLFEIFCFVLFVLEGFLSMFHAHIAFSIRSLPLKDMERLKYFFLFSTLTMATTAQATTGQFWIADTFVMAHHMFCYLTWNTSSYTKKVVIKNFPNMNLDGCFNALFFHQLIHWSSLNWTESRMNVLPLFLGK